MKNITLKLPLKLLLALLLLGITPGPNHFLWAKSPKNIGTEVSEGQKFNILELAADLDIVWGMTFISPDLMVFTQKSGALSTLNLKDLKIEKIEGAPKAHSEGQAGLLDVLKDPDSDWIYFTYAKPSGETAVTTLARAKLKNNKLIQWSDLLITKSQSDDVKHFGSRIAFSGDYVFFSLGDRGHRPNGQDLKTHAGSILRLHKDGRVPEDNPFVKEAKALPEIWSWGHRNVQGLAYDQQNDNLWAIEHGPRGGDELNLIKKGANYGWPVVSLGREYWNPFRVGEATSKEGMVDPVMQYTPSIAPGSLLLYSGKVFTHWKGNLFSGALALTHLNRLVLEGTRVTKEERLLKKLDYRIRAVIEGPDGLLYLSTDDGKILQIAPHS